MNQELHTLIDQAQTICIVGHTSPDGDCLGSTLGMKNYLKRYCPEKEVKLYLMEAHRKFSYLPGFDEILHVPEEKAYDLCIMCDCGGFERLGNFAVLAKRARELYVVDHHVTSTQHFPHATILPESSSTSEIMFDLLDESLLNQDIASCLYTGIIHDTGVFKYSCTSAHTMEVAGKLMNTGIAFPDIVDDSFFRKSYAQQRIQGKVLLDSRLLLQERVLAGFTTRKEMAEFSVGQKDIDGIVAAMRETAGIDAAIFLYEVQEQQFKVSLRSNNSALDVSAVCAHFGGGGHRMAAGCMLSGSPEEIFEKLSKELLKQMDRPDFSSRRK